MEKKELWLALSALTVAASSTNSVAGPERAGVAGQVNPAVEGQLTGEKSRVLFVGSDVFRDEVVRTDNSGLAHLMFLDQSSLTVGPNSEVVIDRFVYDPDSNTGKLTLSATKGVLRFVGGALSKTGDVEIKTPVGSLGIRGGVGVVEIDGPRGETIFCFLYGEEASARSTASGDYKFTREHERCLIVTEQGVKVEPLNMVALNNRIHRLWGPDLGDPPTIPQLPYTADLRELMQKIADQADRDDRYSDEREGTDAENRDIDDLAS